jgi:hypothetical protein
MTDLRSPVPVLGAAVLSLALACSGPLGPGSPAPAPAAPTPPLPPRSVLGGEIASHLGAGVHLLRRVRPVLLHIDASEDEPVARAAR